VGVANNSTAAEQNTILSVRIFLSLRQFSVTLPMWVAAKVQTWLTLVARWVAGALPLPACRGDPIITIGAHRDLPVFTRRGVGVISGHVWPEKKH